MIKKALKLMTINVTVLIVTLLTAALPTSATEKNSILLLGDSLSAAYGLKQNQGWVHLLNQQLNSQNKAYHIINASISGETTAGGLSRLPKLISQNTIDYLLIELGGNDGLRGFPPKLIKNNLLQIIHLAKKNQIEIWLMNIKIPPNYGPRYNKMFTETFTEVARQENITLVPFFMEDIAINQTLMQNDGIHPNLKAQPLIRNIMAKEITQLIKE
jgi:acyl-CoA thioesterase-1